MEIMALKRKKRKSVVKGRRWSQRVTESSDALAFAVLGEAGADFLGDIQPLSP